jgi:hypothetical protein
MHEFEHSRPLPEAHSISKEKLIEGSLASVSPCNARHTAVLHALLHGPEQALTATAVIGNVSLEIFVERAMCLWVLIVKSCAACG